MTRLVYEPAKPKIAIDMNQRFHQHTFANGLTLLCEPMPGVKSAALSIMVPAGAADDPAKLGGSATILSDLVLRGAGQRDSRALTDYLDRLGLQRYSSVSVHHTRFGCAAVGDKVLESIAAYADIIRKPLLPKDGFLASRDLAMQAIEGLRDDPRQQLMVALRRIHLPFPLGRNPMGEMADLKRLTAEKARADWRHRYHATGMIISLAGAVDFKQVKAEVQKYFGDMPAGKVDAIKLRPSAEPVHFIKQKNEQTHIGLAYPSVLETDKDYYQVRLAMEILGGSMSGRLFTEVREKRGLCYAVWAGYSSLKGVGSILAYAGSTNQRAQQTLDCVKAEIHRLQDGITTAELERAKIGVKSALIMAEESTSARAGALAHDFFTRGRVRTLDEIGKTVDAVTVDSVNAWLARHPAGPFTTVVIGPKMLKV